MVHPVDRVPQNLHDLLFSFLLRLVVEFPAASERKGHEDVLYLSIRSEESELCASVIDKVELCVSGSSPHSKLYLCLCVLLVSLHCHNGKVRREKGVSLSFDELEPSPIILPCEIINKSPSYSSSLISILDVEVIITNCFVFWIEGLIKSIHALFQHRMEMNCVGSMEVDGSQVCSTSKPPVSYLLYELALPYSSLNARSQ
jgi:hypothetical protein